MQHLCDMPGNGFSLSIRVSCQIDMVALFCVFFQFFDNVFLALHIGVLRLKAVFYIHTQFRLRQIPDVTHRGNDIIALAQIFLNGFRLCRRLHDH